MKEGNIGYEKANPFHNGVYNINWVYGLMAPWDNEDIAKRDGFKSAENMFKWFNKKYNLSQSRRFAVYRWRYQ